MPTSKLCEVIVRQGFDQAVGQTAVAGRHPRERAEQRVDHLPMAADEKKMASGEHFEDLREERDAGVERGIGDVGQRHAAGLADDLAGELHAGEQDEHRQAEGEAEDGFAGQQRAEDEQVFGRRNRLAPEERREQERDGHGEQCTDLPGDGRGAQHRQRHQQAADAREDQDEDQELVEVEGEERGHE